MPGYVGLRKLTEDEREELTRWAQSRTLPSGEVFRARLILALADDKSYSRIEEELGTSRPTIARWKARFEELGIPGLDARHKGSSARTVTPAVQARVLRKDDSAAGRREYAVVLPQNGDGNGSEQVHSAADLVAGPAQAT
jgi:hypothetical protein